jgi:hypothetical protein
MEKIVSIKILRPITLPIIGIFLITYIIVAYVERIEWNRLIKDGIFPKPLKTK